MSSRGPEVSGGGVQFRWAVGFVITLAGLVVGCGEPPVTVPTASPFGAEVYNASAQDVELAVANRSGPLTDSARPDVVASGVRANVTFYVPAAGDWWIAIDGSNEIYKEDIQTYAVPGCTVLIQIEDEGLGVECKDAQ